MTRTETRHIHRDSRRSWYSNPVPDVKASLITVQVNLASERFGLRRMMTTELTP